MSSITEQVGRVVGGRYRLLAPIGAGASSQVFAAVDTRLGRRVAVKVLHPALESDETFLRLFRAEARFAASLDHPNVMRVFDWGEEKAGPYLVLELLTGGSLRSLLDQSGRLSHSQVANIGRQAASGLAYAHRRGIIHRDIKPGNILFDEDGHLRLGDFGVARAIAEAATTEPTGSIFGTARYTSPEQATGERLDDRTDVYSLALVLYEALTGKVPFSADSVNATLTARVGARLPPAPELGPLAPILAAAAIAEPLARLEAADLAAELEQLQRQLPPAAPLPLRPLRLGPQLEALADRDLTDLDPGHPSSSSTEVLPAGAGALVAGAGAPSEPGTGAERPAKSPWRRLGAVLAALIGLALIGVAAVAGIIHFEVYGHVVPDVVGLPLATAKVDLTNEDLRLKVAGSSYDARVPSGSVIRQSVRHGRREKADFLVKVTLSKGPAPVTVPDVEGEPQKLAVSKLTRAHLRPVESTAYNESVPTGYVVSEEPSPAAGKRLPGTKVRLTVSKGPHPRSVPAVIGESAAAAEQAIESVQLHYALAPGQYSTRFGAGTVISEDPAAHSSLPRGGSVTLVISLGEPYVTVPPLRGDSLSSAEATLKGLGLQWSVYGPSFGAVVIDSEPAEGDKVREGTTVDLYVI